MEQYKTFSEAYALIIAISEYEGCNALPHIVTKDAHDVGSLLTSEKYCGYDSSKVKLLINSDATLLNICKELSSLADKVNPHDTVFIYFSGHGYNEADEANPSCFLVPIDFDRPEGGMLSEKELSNLLSKIQSDRLLFVIDACHSAGAATFKNVSSTTEKQVFSEKSLERLSKGRGKVLLASSRDYEKSLLLTGDQNSLFTKHFLAGLKGNAGSINDEFIRIFDIFSYIEQYVPKEAENVGREQHPVFKGSLENNFPVALRYGGIIKQITSSEITTNTVPERKLEDILAELYPMGPSDQDIWLRAGGDISRLKLSGTGRSQWFSAIRILQQGGGGSNINVMSLCNEIKLDFPNHPDVQNFD